MGEIFQALLAGVIVGPLARLVLPGKQNINLILTIVLGAVGAVLGDLLYTEVFNMGETGGIDWTRWLIRVGVAALAVILVGMIMGRGKSSTPAT